MERKLATVLFVDLVGSTELVADTDPEVVRRRVGRFFDQVSHCIVTHGGTVEKFAGDAVMAAFGIPLAHEDDAERAARAALATMERVRELGLRARVGIESGEVVADDSESTFATGEAVNLAARLQQHAAADEILIGPAATRLVRGRIELEPLDPIELRGWSRPIQASRVVCAVEQGTPIHSLAAPLVGRETELELLENTFARTVRDRRASLVTVYGEPGVGKSRLVREFLDGLEGATILKGRCLPYGEGVTYWPVAEMVKAAAGISDDDPLDRAYEKLCETCEDEAVADLLGLAVGVLEAVEAERASQEIAWAVRALVEQLAGAQPLVLAFEDVHWGEEPLLDLIEHLAAWVREAPLLILCLARPELLDVRPTWGGGRVRSVTLELEPLQAEESAELVGLLTGELDVPVDVATVLAKTEGNPLFVEETIRMLAERAGSAGERIPDTLQALIAARIDRLAPAQRRLLQRASVMGRIFMQGAIERLTPENDVAATIDELLLRDFVVREPRASISGEEAFKFKHVLIREVAYAGLSKGSRADLHQSFAGWLAEHAGDELLEIRAFHLDQAARLLAELDGATPPELAEEAAEALEKAGRRALTRESFRSGRKLLVRSAELAPTLERRYHAARAAWRLGDFAAVHVEMELVRSEAAATGDRSIEGRALTGLAEVALNLNADAPYALELVERALGLLEADGGVPLFDALWARMHVTGWLGDNEDFRATAKRAIAVAQDLGREDLEALVTQALAQSYLLELDAEHAEPLVQRAHDLAEQSGSVVGRALALQSSAFLAWIRGAHEDVVASYEESRAIYDELGLGSNEATVKVHIARSLLELGEIDKAERLLRDAVRVLKGLGDRAHLCEAQRSLSQLLVKRGALEEAERLALEARESVGPEDRLSLSTTRVALGIVRFAQGRAEEARELFAEALEGFRTYGMRAPERGALDEIVTLLRDAGLDGEATVYEDRLAELSFSNTAPIA
ncbi:MAG TPA: AAA family ATPase [Gaiellaceae bacterium]|nr:AAA family ATPase [Gaiellaceae bacterium]